MAAAATSGWGEDPAGGDWTTVTRSGRSGPAGRYPTTTTARPAPTAAEVAKGLAGLEVDDDGKKTRGSSRLDKYDIPVEVSGEGAPAPADGFEEAGLAEAVLRNVARCGYDCPTPVQRYSMPIVLSGRDLMACAQTGSGKTAAFCLPMVSGLVAAAAADESGRGGGAGRGGEREAYRYDDYSRAARPRALVLAPTRELAAQVWGSPSLHLLGCCLCMIAARTPCCLFVWMRRCALRHRVDRRPVVRPRAPRSRRCLLGAGAV
jgi:ATP-dependent RNA helicase DDX3X